MDCEGNKTESHGDFVTYKAGVPYLTFYAVQSVLLGIFIVIEALWLSWQLETLVRASGAVP